MVLWEYNDSFDERWSSGGAVHYLQLRQTLSTIFRCSLTFGILLFRFVINRPSVTWYANISMIVTQRFDWDWRLFCFPVRYDYHRENDVQSYDAESAFPWHHFVQSLNQKGPLTTTTVYFPVLVRVDASARILQRDKHLPGVVTGLLCGGCWLFRSPLEEHNPKTRLGIPVTCSKLQSWPKCVGQSAFFPKCCNIRSLPPPPPPPPMGGGGGKVRFGPKNVCFHVKNWSMVEAVHSASLSHIILARIVAESIFGWYCARNGSDSLVKGQVSYNFWLRL